MSIFIVTMISLNYHNDNQFDKLVPNFCIPGSKIGLKMNLRNRYKQNCESCENCEFA